MTEDKFYEQLYSIKDQIKFGESFHANIKNFKGIVVAGMGGSGISGRIFSEMYEDLPVIVVDSYNLPKFVDNEYFFIAVSYSGNTEETLSVVGEAKRRGVTVNAITSGGALEKIADNLIKIPSGLQPREAIGYLLMPLINTFIPVTYEEKQRIVNLIEELEKGRSPLWQLAQKIVDSKKIPYILSWEPFRALSYRFKTQFNENSKMFALNHTLSEQNHNELVPQLVNRGMADKFIFIVIEGDSSSRNSRRLEIMERKADSPFIHLKAKGSTHMERLFYLLHYIDILTVEVGLRLSNNPEDVRVLEKLKEDLSKIE
ncbi:MAG: bifunctional phosphoglucose/phosphomannose isomerase [Cuniculiplasma sp.]